MVEKERRVASGLTPNGSNRHGASRPSMQAALPVRSACFGWQYRLAVLWRVSVSY